MSAISTYEYISNLGSLERTAEVARSLLDEGRKMGFSGLAMAWRPDPRSADVPHFEVQSLPGEYFVRYAENRYDDHSAVVAHMNRTTDPFAWHDLPVNPADQPLAYRILQEAADFGLRFGWTVPVHGQGRVGGFVSASSSDRVDRPDRLDRFHLMALSAHGRITELRRPNRPLPVRLTALEREVVAWLAIGKTVPEIAGVIGLADRLVQAVVVQVGMKLETHTLVHTVVEAVRRRLVDL